MPLASTIPDRLYKYRSFDTRTIELIVADRLYFADPSTFNDPLDAKPCIEADLAIDVLEGILARLIEKRVTDRMSAAAKTLKYRGPKTVDHIGLQSHRQAKAVIDEIAYQATEPDGPQNAHQHLLAYEIQRELLQQYDKGVLSLGARFDCPLMWSHYGDQHQGLCLGYQVPANARSALHQVQYGGGRIVKTSQVLAMLDGDSDAKVEVEATVLLRKAPDWGYEKEWRMIGARGVQDSKIDLLEITFGMRCPGTVKHAVAKALEGRDHEVALFEMRENFGTFELKREPLQIAELASTYPRRSLSIYETFQPYSKQ